MSLELVIVLGLATYRLARAVAVDDITERFRMWFYKRQWTFLFRLVTCPFCIGWWLAGIVTFGWFLATTWPGTVETLILWQAVAGVGAIGSLIDTRLQGHHD